MIDFEALLAEGLDAARFALIAERAGLAGLMLGVEASVWLESQGDCPATPDDVV